MPGNLMLGLPRCRGAQVESGAQRCGHDGNLLTSSARPEQFVEQIAEPCLEHVDLGLRDRHMLGPVVGGDSFRKIMFRLRRAAGKGPRLAEQLVKLL